MPERLCIFLDPDVLTADAVICDEKQRMLGSYKQCSLAELSQLQDRREVIIFLSGLQVKISYVSLPAQNIDKLSHTLAYILEDELAENIEDLHFAVNLKLQFNQHYPVAIIKKSKLDDILQKLAQHHLYPEYIIPDIMSFNPRHDESWLIVDRVLMYCSNKIAFSFEEYLLPLVSKQYPIVSKIISFSDSDPELTQKIINEYDIPHEQQPVSYCEAVTKLCNPNQSLNLLSAGTTLNKKSKYIFKLWYSVAIIALLCLSVYFIDRLTQYFILKKQLTSLQNTSISLYQTLFPGAKTVVSPEIRVKRLLTDKLGNQTGAHFFLLLQKFATSISQEHGLKINRLEYADNKLHLEIQLPQFQHLENLERQLQANKLQVKQLNAHSYQNQVKATLEVSL